MLLALVRPPKLIPQAVSPPYRRAIGGADLLSLAPELGGLSFGTLQFLLSHTRHNHPNHGSTPPGRRSGRPL